MEKKLHAVQFDGLTFGMKIDTGTEAYKNFKKSLKYENCISIVERCTISALSFNQHQVLFPREVQS